MNDKPYLSIITVNRNNANGLLQTLQSVWNDQKYISVEQIVIDGASTDDSIAVIKQFDNKLAYWVSEPDTGIYQAMNKGIAQAKGEYFLFLNSGDWLIPHILEKVFATPLSEDIVYGDRNDCYDQNKVVLHRFDQPLSLLYFFIDVIPHQCAFMHRNLFDAYQYNEANKIISDWEFFIQKIVFEQATTAYLPYPICYFNMFGMSCNKDFDELQAIERKATLERLLPPQILKDYKWVAPYYEFFNWANIADLMPALKGRKNLSRKAGRAVARVIYFNKLSHKVLSLFKKEKAK